MKRVVDGILLYKAPQGDRNQVGQFLLRSGRQISVLMFGAIPAGTKRHSNIAQLGHALQLEIQQEKARRAGQLYKSRNWSLLWAPKYLSSHYQAYQLTLHFLQLMRQCAPPEDLFDLEFENDSQAPTLKEKNLFNLMSNALFYFDADIKEHALTFLNAHWCFFLLRLLNDLGIYPSAEHCSLCHQPFDLQTYLPTNFSSQYGPLCAGCHPQDLSPFISSPFPLALIQQTPYTPYTKRKSLFKSLSTLKEHDQLKLIQKILDYLCYHFHLNHHQLHSPKGLLQL